MDAELLKDRSGCETRVYIPMIAVSMVTGVELTRPRAFTALTYIVYGRS